MDKTERRRSRRFPLRQPAYLQFLAESNDSTTIYGTSENVSKDGVLMRAATAVPLGSKAQLELVLEARTDRNVRLTGNCTVLRVEENIEHGEYTIAVGCDQPFTLVD